MLCHAPIPPQAVKAVYQHYIHLSGKNGLRQLLQSRTVKGQSRAMLGGNTNDGVPGLFRITAKFPYPVILAATKGDPDAMKIVLQHFSGYIARLSMRKLYDERGNVYFGVDHDIRERLQAKLMMAVLTFKAEE